MFLPHLSSVDSIIPYILIARVIQRGLGRTSVWICVLHTWELPFWTSPERPRRAWLRIIRLSLSLASIATATLSLTLLPRLDSVNKSRLWEGSLPLVLISVFTEGVVVKSVGNSPQFEGVAHLLTLQRLRIIA